MLIQQYTVNYILHKIHNHLMFGTLRPSGHVPHCHFYLVALLVILKKQFSNSFQFSDCNSLGTCQTYSATLLVGYQPIPLLKTPGSTPHIPGALKFELIQAMTGHHLILVGHM